MSTDRDAQILALWHSGNSYRSIAAEVGLSHTMVGIILRRLEAPAPSPREQTITGPFRSFRFRDDAQHDALQAAAPGGTSQGIRAAIDYWLKNGAPL